MTINSDMSNAENVNALVSKLATRLTTRLDALESRYTAIENQFILRLSDILDRVRELEKARPDRVGEATPPPAVELEWSEPSRKPMTFHEAETWCFAYSQSWRMPTRGRAASRRRRNKPTASFDGLQPRFDADTLRADLAACRNLIAVMHRDGGHYIEAHGIEKAAVGAKAIFHAQANEIAELTQERDRARYQHDHAIARAEKAEAELAGGVALDDDAKWNESFGQRGVCKDD